MQTRVKQCIPFFLHLHSLLLNLQTHLHYLTLRQHIFAAMRTKHGYSYQTVSDVHKRDKPQMINQVSCISYKIFLILHISIKKTKCKKAISANKVNAVVVNKICCLNINHSKRFLINRLQN